MITQSLRASRSSLARIARQQASRRTFVAATAVRQDLVKDLYLKNLAGYKPAPIKASDSDGYVQKWNAPKAPKSPEESDIANELKSYEAQQVELEGQAESADGSAAAPEEDWFEPEPEEDEPAKH